jgi:hypothetical protein
MNNFVRYSLFILLTPVFIILAAWVSVFPHEYAHSTVAWLYGFKTSPFAIEYGHFNWRNVIFASGIDEHVNYYLIYLLGHPDVVGFAALAGPGIATLGMYFFSLFLLCCPKVKNYPYLFYFFCWVNIINLSELISYIVLRSFSAHGDIGHIEFAWGVSPWCIFLIGGFLLVIALWYFFTDTLIELYYRMRLNTLIGQEVFLILATFMLFGYPGVRMFLDAYGMFATVLGVVFCVLTPLITILCWSSHVWVKRRLQQFIGIVEVGK